MRATAAWSARSAPAAADSALAAAGPWRALEAGLDWAELPVPLACVAGDGTVRVLRIDPGRYELKLLMASAPGQGKPLTPREWCRQERLTAAVNAGMFAEDYLTAVSLLRSRHHANNLRLTRHMAVLAFDRRDDGVPPVQIIDRESQDAAALSARYGSLVQSIRMVALDGRNVWQPQERRWSAAAVGIDTLGRVLLLHARSPYPMHDLVDVLLGLPLGLRNLMYLEGGAQAQLYVGAGGEEHELTGCYAPDGPAAGREAGPSPVPNVIGVVRLVPWAPTDALHGDGPRTP
ncbi:MAG: phosphodiester glycosidase family protein [Candidatus Krumholzibacteriia bacterium]